MRPVTKKQHQGFTLMEVMVVVTIISIMAGISMISFNQSPSKLLKRESAQLRTLILSARDEAIFQSRPLALEFFPDGYRFLVLGENKEDWKVISDKHLAAHQVIKTVELSPYRDDLLIEMQKSIIPDEDAEESKSEAENAPTPQVFFLPSGEVSPFELVLEFPAKVLLRLGFDSMGKAKIVTHRVF